MKTLVTLVVGVVLGVVLATRFFYAPGAKRGAAVVSPAQGQMDANPVKYDENKLLAPQLVVPADYPYQDSI